MVESKLEPLKIGGMNQDCTDHLCFTRDFTKDAKILILICKGKGT